TTPPSTTTTTRATTTTTLSPDVALAAELERVERGIRGDDRDEATLAALGRDQDDAYAELRSAPDRSPAVLALLPPEIAPIVTANAGAAAELTPLTDPRPEFPPWTIRPPRPRTELLALYREAEAASDIPWQYIASIHLIESRLGRIVGPSTAGALGPMQFIPSSWEAFGEGGDIYSDRDSILAAGRYLADAGGAPGNMDGALFAYNHSDHYVAAVRAYAELMIADERAYDGYYFWPVRYRTTEGVFVLPEGYPGEPAVAAG
ncbi:MAG: lytic transglycosylase domain-containing protein, partial [Actinomycetota bacterium]|nr:lytic transglycosylase domain-containing protein [Actinomycetota bacterium]